MAGRDRLYAVATPPRAPDAERPKMDEKFKTNERGSGKDSRHQPARPDPETGEVPAGPGDAGLESRPEVTAGTPGTRQMSNRRLGIGLGIAAALAILAVVLAAVF